MKGFVFNEICTSKFLYLYNIALFSSWYVFARVNVLVHVCGNCMHIIICILMCMYRVFIPVYFLLSIL